MNIHKQTEILFEETVALLLKTNVKFDTEYRKGWLDGYAKAYTQITGRNVYALLSRANQAIKGSGKEANV